jgi:hypothetical protein
MSPIWFEIERVESDSSQLYYDPKHGTCLDKSLPREYEFRVWECSPGYRGLCGQFEDYRDCLIQFLELCRDCGIHDYTLNPQPTECPSLKTA